MWKQIEHLMSERGLSMYALAKKAGINSSILINMKAGRTHDMLYSTAVKIADTLDVSLDEFR